MEEKQQVPKSYQKWEKLGWKGNWGHMMSFTYGLLEVVAGHAVTCGASS